jgi:hypothetical protein
MNFVIYKIDRSNDESFIYIWLYMYILCIYIYPLCVVKVSHTSWSTKHAMLKSPTTESPSSWDRPRSWCKARSFSHSPDSDSRITGPPSVTIPKPWKCGATIDIAYYKNNRSFRQNRKKKVISLVRSAIGRIYHDLSTYSWGYTVIPYNNYNTLRCHQTWLAQKFST